MSLGTSAYPSYPPGFWRRIALLPEPGQVTAGLEDDVHRFHLRLVHRDSVISEVRAKALRFPWTSCSQAAPFIAEQLVGKRVEDVARLAASEHCTHLLDLAILCAVHIADREPKRFDMQVADRVDGRTTARLAENGEVVMRWQLDGTRIEGPDPWAGLDLRALSRWKNELSPVDAERAALLRRALFVSGSRTTEDSAMTRAADRGPARMGACFTYQLPRALESFRIANWRRDFSLSKDEPLAGFDPDRAFAAEDGVA